jgi:hypothetical protein
MTKLALALVALAGLMSACVYDEGPRRDYRGDGYYNRDYRGGDRDRDGIPNRADRDRDGDGVPNRADRRPNDPGRY